MQEKILQFGSENNMMGIVTIPSKTDDSKPAILILNSGLIHRVGPYRMSVDLSRKMASEGFLVFRFDLVNVGDSLPIKTSDNYRQRTINEISDAMDIISKRYGSNKFISIGLCTGAMNSHIIAVADKRISASIMLDAYAYPTIKFLYNRYSRKLLKLLHPSFFRKILNKVKNKSDQENEISGLDEVAYWELPPKKVIHDELEYLAKNKIHLLFVYTGGSSIYYNYTEQLQDSFKTINFSLIKVYLLNKVDHTFTLQRDRDHLFDLISSWIQEKY